MTRNATPAPHICRARHRRWHRAASPFDGVFAKAGEVFGELPEYLFGSVFSGLAPFGSCSSSHPFRPNSMRVDIRARPALVMAAFGSIAASQLTAQTTSGAFITTLGRDTVAVEQFTRTENVLTGDFVTRQGGVVVNHYVLRFDVNNAPSRLTLTQQRADGSPIPNGPKAVTLTVGDKEAVIVIEKDPVVTRKFAVSMPFPLIGTSLGMFEVAFRFVRSVGADSISFAGLPLNATLLPNPIEIKFLGADSARMWTSNGPLYLRVTKVGEIQSMSGRDTDTKIEVRRVPSIDLRKLIAGFAAATPDALYQ